MKSKLFLIAAGLSLTSLIPMSAFAHTDISIGLGVGGYAPAYVEPAPVYYPPPPPPAYYSQSVYYGPSVTYTTAAYDNRRWHDRDEWEEHREHERYEHGWHEEHYRRYDRYDD